MKTVNILGTEYTIHFEVPFNHRSFSRRSRKLAVYENKRTS